MDADHSLVSSGSPVSDRRGTDSCCSRKGIGRRCCHSSLVRGSFWFAGSCLAELVCAVWARATERVKTNQQKRANLNRGRRSRRCFCQGRRERQSAASDRERREKQKARDWWRRQHRSWANARKEDGATAPTQKGTHSEHKDRPKLRKKAARGDEADGASRKGKENEQLVGWSSRGEGELRMMMRSKLKWWIASDRGQTGDSLKIWESWWGKMILKKKKDFSP